jgi:hypothetical protein
VFFSLLIYAGPGIYKTEVIIICVVLTTIATAMKILETRQDRMIYKEILLFVSPWLYFILFGIRIWTYQFNIGYLWIILFIIVFWSLYPVSELFPSTFDWIHSEMTQPKTLPGKILFRFMLLAGIFGAGVGRMISRTEFNIGFFLVGLLLILFGYALQVYSIKSIRSEMRE